MKDYLKILLGVIILTACSNTSENKDNLDGNKSSAQIRNKIENRSIKLDFFQEIPNKFGLQGDYYTYDTTKITNQTYIFISDLTDIAVIRINGKDIYLHTDSLNDTPRKNNTFQESWKGNGYQVLLKLQIVKDLDEEVYCKGILEIISKDMKQKFKIHGHTIV